MRESVLDRFLRYVQIDTQSAEGAEGFPSTPGQWDLLRLLREELRALGLSEVELDEKGYVTATLPANLPPACPTRSACRSSASWPTSTPRRRSRAAACVRSSTATTRGATFPSRRTRSR